MFNFFTKALIKCQLKDVPEADIDKILAIVEKNPSFFKEMAEAIQTKMKSGMSQEKAIQSFMAERGDEMKRIMSVI